MMLTENIVFIAINLSPEHKFIFYVFIVTALIYIQEGLKSLSIHKLNIWSSALFVLHHIARKVYKNEHFSNELNLNRFS